MSRSGTSRANISALILYLDTEQDRDRYASITDCLGEFSQLVKPFPFLSLDVGDVLLTLNQIDVRNTPPAAIKTLIEGFSINSQETSPGDKHLLTISFVRANEKLEKHISDLVVIIEHMLKDLKSNSNYCFFSPASSYYPLWGILHQVWSTWNGTVAAKILRPISPTSARTKSFNSRRKLPRPQSKNQVAYYYPLHTISRTAHSTISCKIIH